MTYLRIIAGFVLLVYFQNPSTTDWRGLSPLRSTRMDVERSLGRPDQDNKQQMGYYFHDTVVFFHFSSNPQCEQKLTSTSWNVSSDTVTNIYVGLRRPLPLKEAAVDLTKYKKIKAGFDLADRYYYLNTGDGFAIEASEEFILGYRYSPGSKQEHLRCEASEK